MKTLHIQLILTTSGNAIAGNSVELRYFYDNPNDYQYRQLQLSDIADLIQEAECYYYTTIPDFVGTGRRLYDWLDGSDRWLTSAIASSRREGLILAISTPPEADFVGFSDKVNTSAVTATESQPLPSLVHLPWEVLHDGQGFLVERIDPYVVPVRWLPDSGVTEGSLKGEEPADRQLQVLFMATSPDGTNVLDYEREEARILEATARQPLTLVVEESGCLEELSELVRTREQGYFDVFHLTGHGTISDEGARFVTETEIGEPYFASARDIAASFPFRFPKLFFLSITATDEVSKGDIANTLAQEMLKFGARTVLTWELSEFDTDATTAVARLYEALASGSEVAQAMALTYQYLIQNRAREWHLLRLHLAAEMPENLVSGTLSNSESISGT